MPAVSYLRVMNKYSTNPAKFSVTREGKCLTESEGSWASEQPATCSAGGSALAQGVPATNLFSLDILEVESLMRFLCRCQLMTNGSWKPRRIMQI